MQWPDQDVLFNLWNISWRNNLDFSYTSRVMHLVWCVCITTQHSLWRWAHSLRGLTRDSKLAENIGTLLHLTAHKLGKAQHCIASATHGTSAVRLLWRITYQILRQSRPSLRRWTASSSGWPSPPQRRRRLLPPAAPRLAATQATRDKGQHSAATADNTACRQTSRAEWCYTSRSLLSISIPALLRRKETPAVSEHCRDKALYGFRVAIGWVMSRSKMLSDSIGWHYHVGEPWVAVYWRQLCHEK